MFNYEKLNHDSLHNVESWVILDFRFRMAEFLSPACNVYYYVERDVQYYREKISSLIT